MFFNLNFSQKHVSFLITAILLLAISLYFTFTLGQDSQANFSGNYVYVQTDFGILKGSVNLYAQTFRRIRYAKPPLNERRFEKPQDLDIQELDKEKIVDASDDLGLTPGCIQKQQNNHLIYPETFSEDCLYLTIYVPRTFNPKISSRYPVMVQLHGGSFLNGAGDLRIYNGSFIANKSETIVVLVNYRLGAFGFLYLDNVGIDGNMGLQDQLKALEFIQKHIKDFGGDSNKITLFGQSAGATSVAAHLSSRYSKGKFGRAIVESWPVSIPFKTKKDALNIGQQFFDKLKKHCLTMLLPLKLFDSSLTDTLLMRHCLKTLSADTILTAQNEVVSNIDLRKFSLNLFKFSPIIDGDLILEQPFLALGKSKSSIPMIFGATTGEGYLFTFDLIKKPVSKELYILMGKFIQEKLPLLKFYPASKCLEYSKRIENGEMNTEQIDCRYLIAEALGDILFVCPMRNVLNQVLMNNISANIRAYIFDHTLSFDPYNGQEANICTHVSCHGSEIPFVFDECLSDLSESKLLKGKCSNNEKKLAKEMSFLQTEFAHHGEFYGTDEQPLYSQLKISSSSANKNKIWRNFTTVNIDGSPELISDYKYHICNQLDSQGYGKKLLDNIWTLLNMDMMKN